jgi:hypothetical protein
MAAFQVYSWQEDVLYDLQLWNMHKAKTARQHAIEDQERNLRLVQVLKCKLEIMMWWTPTDADWQRVGRLIAHRKYHRALDCLKGLIIACIFELLKMNQAGTGAFT